MSVLGYPVLVLQLICCYKGSIAMENAANFVQITSCTCLGYVVTYECTVMRQRGTLWIGSAFDCGSSSNEIQLLESMYESPDSGNSLNLVTCNDGMIRGRVIRIDERFYTSQLYVTVSYDLIGKNLSCLQDNGEFRKIIGSPTIIHNTGAPYAPPQRPSLIFTDLNLRHIIFSWSPVAADCPAIHYNISASKCGICPATTNHTNVTCTDVPTDSSTCVLAIRTVVCGNITGNESDEARGVFKATTISSRCTEATASASIFAIGLTISVMVFTSIIIAMIKANKRARSIEIATRRRARSSRYEEHPQPGRTMTTESATATTIYDDVDYEIAKVAVIATNKNIAYDDPVTRQTETKGAEHEYAQIH